MIRVRKTTWVDKYRPKKLCEIISHDDIKNTLIESIKTGNLPHLLFYGDSGTGKTSTVLALVRELYGPNRLHEKVLELNASDENGINVVRDKIIKFANIVVGSFDPQYSSPSFKIIILDEADSMTSEAQTALKKVMESTCDITRFVFICNYKSKIITPINSRCACFRFNKIPTNLMIEKLSAIAKAEKLIVSDHILNEITKICDGDARRSINTLQNMKYVQLNRNETLCIKHVHLITSHIGSDFIEKYWKSILTENILKLKEITDEIFNTGYEMNHILISIKNKLIASDMLGNSKSKILIHIGKVERMITSGSDNWIQLISVLTYINSISRSIHADPPEIF
jgi:replication factor C subunit 2/4